MQPQRAVLAVALLATGLSAQQTWIVDPTGTGNFIDLQTAVLAASPGDTLLLRGGGTYTNVTVDRALHLVGEPPQRAFVNYLQCTAGTGVSMTGMDVQYLSADVPVTLEDVVLRRCMVGATVASIHRCTLGVPNYVPGLFSWTTLAVNGGTVVVTESQVYGLSGYIYYTLWCHGYPGPPAIDVDLGGSVTIADSVVAGGQPSTFYCAQANTWIPTPGGPGLYVTSGSARITRSTVSSGYGGAVEGSGTVTYDASTTFVPAYGGGTQVFLPASGGQGAAPGGVMQCRAETGPSLPAAVVASLGAHPPVSFPGVVGPVWGDPAAYVVLVIGLTDGSGNLSASIALPPWVQRGLPVTVQALAAPALGGGPTAAAPVVLHVL